MPDKVAMLDNVAMAVREVAGFLRLAAEMDDYENLRAAMVKRIKDVTGTLPAADQAWFLAFLHQMPGLLRGAANQNAAIGPVMRLLSGTQAAAVLTAGPKPYVLSRQGGRPVSLLPSHVVALALTEAAENFKSPTLTSTQAVAMTVTSSSELLREQAAGLLAAAQQAWRAGSFDQEWQTAIDRLADRAQASVFPWALNDLSLIAALRSPNRLLNSPWLGPLAAQLTAAQQADPAWAALLDGVLASDGGSKPAKTFAAKAAATLAGIGTQPYLNKLMDWLRQHPLDPQTPDPDADALKQLIWLAGTCGPAAAQPLGRLAQRCFVKIPQIGARSVKLGNAALAALGLIEPPAAGAAELVRLQQRVKYPSALKQIEAAMTVAAKRAGLTPEDLAELSIPDFDLGPDGIVRESTTNGGATLSLTAGRRVALTWFDAAAKSQASPPAALKKAEPQLVKDLTERRRALDGMLSAQISRIEGFFVEDRAWAASDWVDRYARHALLGPISRRLIWRMDRHDGGSAAFLPTEAGLLDASGHAVEPAAGDTVRLWHPIDASVDQVLAWRAALIARDIVQPFKQAHREIYRLTDAERETGTYSNRFAGHILRQHQMLELAKARGWTGRLQGAFDSGDELAKDYPRHAIRVAYTTEPILGREDDLGHSGIALRVATDRVVFRKTAPLPLTEVPPTLLSEALHDVDLFVGVASLGTDDTWQDGGPNGRFGDYWQDFAQADLQESGKVRHATLAAILPRLAIGEHCTLEARHLVVQGRLKRYRIHIGSGSVFFEPDGQYLCIVPDRRGDPDDLALPFEGDGMLAAILSKAVLLSRDDLIKDKSILTQMRLWPK